jgi:sulfate-transporting ATPase
VPAILIFALLSIPLVGAYAIFALGISVIYRASRVLNLAHGAMAMVPAYITYSLVRAHVPVLIALVVGVACGAGLGVGVERFFVRRLRAQGPTAQTVGTVAVTGLLIALTAKIWGTTPLIAPKVFPVGVIHIGRSGIRFGDIGLFATGVVVSLALFTFFKRTQVGLAMRGAAQNRRAASLMGIDPDLTAAGAWALGGGLAALGGIMLAAVTNLDPYTLSLQALPAFVAALIGGLESLPGALTGSAIAGLSFGLVPYFSGTPLIGSVVRFSGSPQLALTILTFIVMATRGRRLSGASDSEAGIKTTGKPFRALSSRKLGRSLAIAMPFIIIFPWIVPYSLLGQGLVGIQLALVAASLVVLTGWVGQISLAQASFYGIAALTTGVIVRGLHIGFPLNLFIAAGIAAGAATLLGMVALRVRGLYLAVATLIFAWMCDSFLFRTPWLGAGGGSSTIPAERLGHSGAFPAFDFTSRRTLFYVMTAIAMLVLVSLANVRDTKTGRAFFAIRGSEMAAVSLGIDVVRYKLIAFALSGALAGVAGNLLMVEQRTVVPSQFLFTVSLQFLAVAVVGGLGSLAGAVAAGAVFAALNEVFFRVSALAGWLDIVSAALLALVLLTYPGGLAAMGSGVADRWRSLIQRIGDGPARRASARVSRVADAIVERAHAGVTRALSVASKRSERSSEDAPQEVVPSKGDWLARFVTQAPSGELPVSVSPVPAIPETKSSNGHRESVDLSKLAATFSLEPERARRNALLDVSNVTVRFGGLTAVSDASLSVRAGEIVGLIGPNGAGKTTFFNAILGLNDPSSGQVQLFGEDITPLPPHVRARRGIARTFQVLQLFTELTVFENLLVATHLHNGSGVFSNLAAGPSTLMAERDARQRVRYVLSLLGLESYDSTSVRGLPFGVLRMIELGRALVTGAPLIMLDEPASGLNEAETDRLSEVITGVRTLGVSVLLIEHDVRMVTSVSDYMYVLAQGKLLTEGSPAEVQRHPEVIAAYLGEPTEATVDA